MQNVDMTSLPFQISHKYMNMAVGDVMQLLEEEVVDSKPEATALLVNSLIKAAVVVARGNSQQHIDELTKLLTTILEDNFNESELTFKLLDMDCKGEA